MPTDPMQLGVAAVLTLLILKEVFNFLKLIILKKSDHTFPKEFMSKFNKVVDETHEMYRLHNVKDADGRPVWYVKQSLETAITNLSENISAQSIILARIADSLLRAEEKAKEHDAKLDQILANGRNTT